MNLMRTLLIIALWAQITLTQTPTITTRTSTATDTHFYWQVVPTSIYIWRGDCTPGTANGPATGVTCSAYHQIAALPVGTTDYTDVTVQPSTLYWYMVCGSFGCACNCSQPAAIVTPTVADCQRWHAMAVAQPGIGVPCAQWTGGGAR